VGQISGQGTEMAIGTVKWFNEQEGYGCITPDDDGGDLFTQCPESDSGDALMLKEGQRVRFEVAQDAYGPLASNIEVICF
jgi:cold shock CspA family protein